MNPIFNLSIYIDRPPADVYEFVYDPLHLPLWAAGLAQSEVKREGDGWVVNAPFGTARVTFVPKNPFYVLDHDVQLDSGITVHNPMRVVPHGDGSEFLFTLIRQPSMTEDQFMADKEAVEKDLLTLKNLLECNTKQ
ncbi:Polyketide cyclase / dehydrase and lipid transport [Thiothrix caldifontis]|uniref:Polyketide cyclase / dehydrase and lipid transport n=1 Tax=Thiothrix caldifontis TaxID=525918 RepID=A0A1H4GKL8_9GAMM|nr:SRPBCC family protein [Thiothrix caldifontis]SEB10146.1 Polyketide cyclase / dehydrase and lipid transport [Thiothrix caldifontis]